MTPRSWLFVPCDRPDRMRKALASGADALILDLEDSVSLGMKPEARANLQAFLDELDGSAAPQIWVRINPLASPETDADLAGLSSRSLEGLILPKAAGAEDVEALGARLGELEVRQGRVASPLKVLPIATETPAAVFNLASYRTVAPGRLAGLTWGAEDLSAAVGATSPRSASGRLSAPYQFVRSMCLFAAAAANVPAIDGVFPALSDTKGLAAYAGRARRDGFAGMLAIHPAQVAIINELFTPGPEEILRARRIVLAFEGAPGGAGALSVDGEMVDAPHLAQAQLILQRWAAETARVPRAERPRR